MNKVILSLLLASVAATPAVAGPRDRDERTEQQQKSREERQQAREARQEQQQQTRAERPERPAVATRSEVARPQFENNGAVDGQAIRSDRAVQALRDRRRLSEKHEQIAQDGALRQSDRPLPAVMRPRTRTPVVSDVPRAGTQPPLRTERRRHPQPNWATNWRDNNRYDWRRWRDHNRSRFHLSFYYDPFGWGYQPYSIGWRLWPSYYSSRYWINDPWAYRLPYAPAGYQWVRYYDDAILVDTWSGEVVDVIRNFFW